MSGIFIIRSDKELVELEEQAYESENLLQSLLEQYPQLLAGKQMNDIDPRRWLLICREAGLPSREGGGDRWSIDRLFLDQDAIPTIVEVKRSDDARIRREVVGQMLDYASNALVFIGLLRKSDRCSRMNVPEKTSTPTNSCWSS